ncbi:DUF974-domain-containing protein [Serendipita vermifera]|nr:DUF974-domain-containing protein [Serendipita vermifera]
MDGTGGHLLALKVMRVSRPSLLGQWQPFVESSSHFDAYNASSITSLQHRPRDEASIPSTARDFNALSPLLSLPASFGSISLGETFASCLCLMNQTNYEIEGVQVRVEMQSATSKNVLLELGGPEYRLGPLGTVEGIVSSEIKELGQHTLSCIVHYRVPQGLRPPAPSDDPSDPRAQLFRKHYRFPVNNPFSVKSKVHLPKSPTALMSKTEREKVFLEIHLQNLTQEPMWFEKLEFRPVDGWTSVDSKTSDQSPKIMDETEGRSPNSLVHPQDTIQYVYTLMPAMIPVFPVKPVPGSVIPLGRLDMVWRSTFGEPGRLLTSMLSRRVPQAPSIQIPSALPPHLQRVIAPTPRPRSPTTATAVSTPSTSSRPSSPVPYKSRQPNRPQTPVTSIPPPTPWTTDIQVDLVVDKIPNKDMIRLNTPFTIHFTASVAASALYTRVRVLRLAVQHTIPSRRPNSSTQNNTVARAPVVSANLTSKGHSPAPSVASTARILSMDFHPNVVQSPRKHQSNRHEMAHAAFSYPSPYLDESDNTGVPSAEPATQIGTGVVEFLGTSLVELATFKLAADSDPLRSAPAETGSLPDARKVSKQEFTLEFLPTRIGMANVGGIRLLLLSDEEEREDAGETAPPDTVTSVSTKRGTGNWGHSQESRVARILYHWPVVAEVWVQP